MRLLAPDLLLASPSPFNLADERNISSQLSEWILFPTEIQTNAYKYVPAEKNALLFVNGSKSERSFVLLFTKMKRYRTRKGRERKMYISNRYHLGESCSERSHNHLEKSNKREKTQKGNI